MTRREERDTVIQPAPPESELVLLAGLAFASRNANPQASNEARNLIYLSPEALDMDLADPMQRDFGDYELLEKIGQGGMGVVYRARQRSLDRECALKLLSAGPWAPTRFIDRFRREAQSAARLEHPNIVTVYDSGSQHDLNYFSMRLVRGESLATLLAREGRMSPRRAARILRIVADAVDYAHRLGVLHLDLKPGNVLIDELGVPLVADFGLARRVDHAFADTAGDASGTPSYMAPEQVDEKAHRIGRATDIYGLGAILYELLCDQPPFIGSTAEATLEHVLQDEVVPPRKHDAKIPRDLEAVCLKCLRKDPAERYATAADLAEDLRSYLDDRPVTVRKVPPMERAGRWVRREPKLAAAVAAVGIALIGGLLATAQQWQRAEASALTARQVNWEGRRETALELQRDGRGVEALERLVANLRELEESGEASEAEVERLRIGLLRGQGAHFIDTILVADATPSAVGMSPDGSLMAVGFNDLSIRWYGTEDLEEQGRVDLRPVLVPSGNPQERWQTSEGEPRGPQLLRFIGNGRLLVTLEWRANYVRPTEGDSWLVDLERAAIVAPPIGYMALAYGADGQHALLADPDGQVMAWQTAPWEAQSRTIGDASEALVWLLSPDGRLAFSLGPQMVGFRVQELGSDRASETVSLPSEAAVSAWKLSPDGRQLAVGNIDGDVFLLDTQSLQVSPLQVLGGREATWLDFSDDGAWLVLGFFDGLVQVVDIASGDLLVSGEMRAQFPVNRVAVSRSQRLVVAAGEGATAIWRVADKGIRAGLAHRIGFAPPAHEAAGGYPVDWSLEQGLMAGAGFDGQIRLWRLPRSHRVAELPGYQRAELTHHNARRVVDVEWDRLRLISPRGRVLSEPLELPQPPGYVELIDDGRILLATVGAELRTYGTTTTELRARYDPVELPATPQRLLASEDGRVVLLSFGGHGHLGHEDRLRLFDAFRGRWLPGELALHGPTRRFVFSPNGQWIAAVGPSDIDGVTSVVRRDGLELIAEYPQDPYQPVVWAEIRDDRVLLLTRAADLRLGSSSLLVWNPFTDEIEERIELGTMGPLSFIAGDDRIFVTGTEYDLILTDDGQSIRLPRIGRAARIEPSPAMALSADERLLARAYRYEVELHDARTGALMGTPLTSGEPPIGAITELDFTNDGNILHAEMLGYKYQWPIESERATVVELEAELERLRAAGERAGPLRAPTEAERRRLRGNDPGPWPHSIPRREIPVAPNSRPGVDVPARAPDTPPLLLDLSGVYTQTHKSLLDTYWNPLASMRRYPMGVQRIDGIEFDIRGMTQVGLPEARGNSARAGAYGPVECLAVPAVGAHTPAIHLLIYAGLPTPVETGATLAELTLRYGDGDSDTLPLRAGFELPGYAGEDQRVPIVFATDHILGRVGGPSAGLSAPRLKNPAPENELRCLDIAVTPRTGSLPLTLFAITLEPPAGDAVVIAPPDSGTIR